MFIAMSLKTITIGILLVACSLTPAAAENDCVQRCKELLEGTNACNFKNRGDCVSHFCASNDPPFPDLLCCSDTDCLANEVCGEDDFCTAMPSASPSQAPSLSPSQAPSVSLSPSQAPTEVCREDPNGDTSLGPLNLYVTTRGSGAEGSTLYKINEIDGSYTKIGKIVVKGTNNAFITVNGMTYDRFRQQMYAHAARFGAGSPDYNNALYTLNLTTAEATFLSKTELARGVGPLAANCEGELYGWIGGNNNINFADVRQNLARFNMPIDGTAEDLGQPMEVPLIQFPGLGFDTQGRLNLIGGVEENVADEAGSTNAYAILNTTDGTIVEYLGNQTDSSNSTYKGNFKPDTDDFYSIDYDFDSSPSGQNEFIIVTRVTAETRNAVDLIDVGCIPGVVFTVAFTADPCQ